MADYQVLSLMVAITKDKLFTFTKNNIPLQIREFIVNGDVLEVKALGRGKYFEYFKARNTQTGTEILFDLSGNDSTAAWVFDDFGGFGDKVVFEWSIGELFRVNQTQIDDIKAQNTSLFINDVEAISGTPYYYGDVIKLVADDGLIFFRLEEFYTSVYNYSKNYYFEVSDDGKTAQSEYFSWWGYNDLGFVIETRISTPTDNKGINDAYLLTKEQAKEITRNSYIDEEITIDGNGQTMVTKTNYGSFILGLVELPFIINPELIIGKESVYLGSYDTKMIADSVKTDLIKLNLGVINVLSSKGNLLDYVNTVALLHLPFTDSITLDINYVIDQTIKIEYLINLYDGVATVNIHSSKIDGVIVTKNVNMNISIPFGKLDAIPYRNDPRNIVIGGDNGVKQPYIELLQNGAILEDGFFTIPIIDESVIGLNTGFVKIEEVNLSTTATSREKEMITSLLRSGIIIQ